MRTTLALSAAALLTIGLAGCGADPAPQRPTPSAAESSAPAAESPSSAPASSAPADTSAAGGQDSPEAAAEKMLQSLGNKNPQGICDVMAVQGKPINSIGAGEACTKQWESTLASLGDSLDSLKGAKVSNAQVNGETADLGAATVTPAEAKMHLATFKTAQKIDGKWYLNMGM